MYPRRHFEQYRDGPKSTTSVKGNCVANDGIFEDGVSLRKHRPISDSGPIPIQAIAQALLLDD
jgi:hypothetical protein